MFDNSAMRYVRNISENPEMAHNKILNRIAPGSTVLEFGPASGVMTKYLREEKDCHVSIIEIDKDAFKIAMKYAEHGICSDAQTFEWLEKFKEYRFDYILFVDILEHLTKASEVLAKCTNLLKDEGSVLISVPNAAHNSVIIQMMHNQLLYQDTGILDYSHVHQYTFFELMRMCDESGFKPVYLDATYIAVGKNEFDVSYMDINPKVAEYLKKRPLGEAYQFIVEIKKKAYLDQKEIKIEDALGFDTNNYSLDDDLLESLALIKSSQSAKTLKALSDSPNKHLTFNDEIERLRLQINDIYEANKDLPDNTRIVQMNYDYQEEVRAKNNHIKMLQTSIDDLTAEKGKFDSELELREKRIQTLQKEQEERDTHIKALDDELREKGSIIQQLQGEEDKRNTHIQKLDSELEKSGERIQTLQKEQEERDAHIKELDSELEKSGERIQTLQKEQEERDTHIKELDSEIEKTGYIIRHYQEEEEKRNKHIQKLDEEIEEKNRELQSTKTKIDELQYTTKTLTDTNEQIKSERDHMEEQRNTLVKERDELKEYHRQLTIECAEQKQTIENKEGHIQLLLESDRELQRIHHSRSWKVLTKWWKFRDFLIPPNSKRRLILKLGAKVIRHPIWCLKRVDTDHIKKFTEGVKSGSIASTSARLDNYLGGGTANAEKPEQFPLVDFATIEDVPRLHVPTSSHPTVSIIIPVYNQFAYTYACLKSIAKNSGNVAYEVIIADDCSTDLTAQMKKAITGVKVVRNKKNLRFLLNCNNAAKEAKGKYIFFLNNDTQVMENWLQPLITLIESKDDIGMVGSKLIYPDGRLQEAGGIVWKDASAWNYGHLDDPTKPEYNYVKEVDYISGAAIMIRADLWNRLGGFDDHFAPAYCEDSDLAFQVRAAGYKVMFQPKSVVIHFEGISNGTDTSEGQKSYQVVNSKKFYEKWKEVLEKEHNANGVNPFLARDRSINKKTILFIDHYVPMYDKDAGSRTIIQYLKLFINDGYNVKFIGDNYFPHQPYTDDLQQMGVEVLYGVWYMKHRDEWLQENGNSIQYVWLNRPHITVNYLDALRKYTHARLAYYGMDLVYLREMRRYETTGEKDALQSAESWKPKEYDIMKKVDVNFFLSNVEIEEVNKQDPSIKCKHISINIFDHLVQPQYSPEKREGMVFVGGFTHDPNVDAVCFIHDEILPILKEKVPNIRIHIVGSNAPQNIIDMNDDNLIVHGYISDEELKEIYDSSKIAFIPLRYGAGVKGKVIEAMVNGLPVITTQIGAEGIDGAEDILQCAESAQDLAKLVFDLSADNHRLNELSRQGFDYVMNTFSTEAAKKKLQDVFDFSV